MFNCNNYIYVYFRTLSEQLETIDVKMIAEEIYHRLCSTYQFPDNVSNIKVYTVSNHKPCLSLNVRKPRNIQLLMDEPLWFVIGSKVTFFLLHPLLLSYYILGYI